MDGDDFLVIKGTNTISKEEMFRVSHTHVQVYNRHKTIAVLCT